MFINKKAPYTKIDIIACIQQLREELGYDGDEVVFEEACDIAYMYPDSEINKNFSKTKMPKELLALNTIQNVAMMRLQDTSIQDSKAIRIAYDIYIETNELKFRKGLISRQQFDENKRLGEYLLSSKSDAFTDSDNHDSNDMATIPSKGTVKGLHKAEASDINKDSLNTNKDNTEQTQSSCNANYYSLQEAIDTISEKALKTVEHYKLTANREMARIVLRFDGKEDFANKVYSFCLKKYGSLGNDIVWNKSILTAFYGAICVAGEWCARHYRNEVGMFEYLCESTNIEDVEKTAENELGITNNQQLTEKVWSIIYCFATSTIPVVRKVHPTTDCETVVIAATEDACTLGLLIATRDYDVDVDYNVIDDDPMDPDEMRRLYEKRMDEYRIMQEKESLQMIASNLSNNTMENIFQYITSDCSYYSDGEIVATGRDAVCSFFTQRKNAMIRENVTNYAFPAVVEKSEDSEIPIGTNCVAVAQFDKYNCVGFMTIKADTYGRIENFYFHTTPNVQFKTNAPGRFNITSVPKDAHEAISYRAFAFGVMDENIVLSKHIQRYDVFQEEVQQIYYYILRYLNDDFNRGIMNAAGYMYISAMSEAVKRKTGTALFPFDAAKSITGEIPIVDNKYQQWIRDGYETGKSLFFGFVEYVNLRSPEGDLFDSQLIQSFMDMALYGSTQANKDMDMGKIDVAEYAVKTPAVVVENGIITCPKCGKQQQANRSYCYKCGTPFVLFY